MGEWNSNNLLGVKCGSGIQTCQFFFFFFFLNLKKKKVGQSFFFFQNRNVVDNFFDTTWLFSLGFLFSIFINLRF